MKIGLGTVTFIVFLILRLTHVTDWSWLWVTSPLWISVGLGILMFACAGLLLGVAGKTLKKQGKTLGVTVTPAAKKYRGRLR